VVRNRGGGGGVGGKVGGTGGGVRKDGASREKFLLIGKIRPLVVDLIKFRNSVSIL